MDFYLILIFLIGSLTGFLSGFLGVGAGFILVPLLILVGESTHNAIGSSLAYIVVTAASGLAQHYRQKTFDLKLSLLILLGSVPAAQIGAAITLYIEARYLEILLSILLIGTAIRMIVKKDKKEAQRNLTTSLQYYKLLTAIAIGLFAGFMSGLLGVGGGFLLVPLMILALNVPIHVAIGISLMVVVGSAASGAIRHWIIGHVNPVLVINLAMGGILSAPLGARICKKFSPQTIRIIFCITMFLLAFTLLISP